MIGKQVWSLLLVPSQGKEYWREVDSVRLCRLGAGTGYEKRRQLCVTQRLVFLDCQKKSSVAANVCVQDAHPWITKSSIFDRCR